MARHGKSSGLGVHTPNRAPQGADHNEETRKPASTQGKLVKKY